MGQDVTSVVAAPADIQLKLELQLTVPRTRAKLRVLKLPFLVDCRGAGLVSAEVA